MTDSRAYLPKRGEWVAAIVTGCLLAVATLPVALAMPPLLAFLFAAIRLDNENEWQAARAADRANGRCRACGQSLPPREATVPDPQEASDA